MSIRNRHRLTALIGVLMVCIFLHACQGVENKKDSVTMKDEFTEIVELNNLIKANPENPELYLERAKMFYHHQRMEEAIHDLQKSISLDSNQVDSWHLLADVQLDDLRSMEALETLESAAEVFPAEIMTLLKLSEFQLILKRYEPALTTLQQAEELAPQFAEVHFMHGMVLKEVGDTLNAIERFQKATALDPGLYDGWLEAGYLKSALRHTDAPDYFRAILEDVPKQEDALFALGHYWQNQLNFAQAKKWYRQVLVVNDLHESTYFNLGLILLEQDSIRKANRFFNTVVNINPYFVDAVLYRGLSNEILGQFGAARNDYQTVLKLNPTEGRANKGLDRISTINSQ